MKCPKIMLTSVFIASLFLILVPSAALGQSDPPPKCCNQDPPPPGTNSMVGGGVSSQVAMSDSVLQTMGISRCQFLDNLVSALFPGKDVTLIYSVTTTVSVPNTTSSDTTTPTLVTVTYQYRMLRSQMQPEAINALDQFVITDGVISIGIKFTPAITSALLQ